VSEPVSHAKDSSPAPGASKLLQWVAVAGLVLAVIATSLAVAGWFYYPHKGAAGSGTYSDQQIKDAKKDICDTFTKVKLAVVRTSKRRPPPDGGPIAAFAFGVDARLAFYSGGAYLRDRVSQEPATPDDLAKSVNAMASDLEEFAMNYLAGGAEFRQDELRQALDDKFKATTEMCKPAA
jgi:hypothetical protein